MGVRLAIRTDRQGTLRVRPAHHQRPNGADGTDSGVAHAQGAVRGLDITTDSEYVRRGITKWIVHWKRRHWWKKNRPVRNADLWIELDELAGFHRTNWNWTKGHAGHDDNNRCDWLAQNAARKQISSWADGRAHGALRHDLEPDYIPPNPQAGLSTVSMCSKTRKTRAIRAEAVKGIAAAASSMIKCTLSTQYGDHQNWYAGVP